MIWSYGLKNEMDSSKKISFLNKNLFIYLFHLFHHWTREIHRLYNFFLAFGLIPTIFLMKPSWQNGSNKLFCLFSGWNLFGWKRSRIFWKERLQCVKISDVIYKYNIMYLMCNEVNCILGECDEWGYCFEVTCKGF